ncbi:MAG: endonuclease/exonuclease/phosphatase family protein, partial [Shewanella sp.]
MSDQSNDNRTNKNSSKLLCFNARSLKNQKTGADIAAFIQTQSADIIGVNETWLKNGMLDHEFIPRSYMVFRRDRPGRAKDRGGGVLLAVRPHLQPKRVHEFEIDPSSRCAEIVWVKIQAGNKSLLLGSAYRAPNLNAKQNEEFQSVIDKAASKMHEYDGLILMGDFNLDINWAVDPPIPCKNGLASTFLSNFLGIGLTQLITGPTRTPKNQSGKTLDLLLTDVPEIFSGVEVVAGVSDHDALRANLSLNVVRPKKPPVTVFNFNRANYDELEIELAHSLPQNFIEMNIDAAWEQWSTQFFEFLRKFVPVKKIKDRSKTIPWLDAVLTKMLAKRDKLFSAWHKIRTTSARELYAKARNDVQRAIRRAKDEYMWKLGSGPQGSKFFWKHIHAHSKAPINNTAFVDGGRTISQPQEVATLFSQSFQKNFSADFMSLSLSQDRRAPARNETQPAQLAEITVSPGEVKNLLQAIKSNAAMGPDKIPAIVLKKCCDSVSPSLAALFSLSLQTGVVPLAWKEANVTPVHKDGDKTKVDNYRPISVTSLPGKVLE